MREGRYYYGDFRLYGPPIDRPVEAWTRTVTQVFQGVDRENALAVPHSQNDLLRIEAKTLGAPNPSSKTAKGWVATYQALLSGLRARGGRYDPFVWIEDDSLSKVVGSYSAPTVTSNAHGFSNGDRVLVRRAGIGLWSIATVGGATTNTFALSGIFGGHAIQAGDEIHLIEACWFSMVCLPPLPSPAEDAAHWYARELTYLFEGGGTSPYARTAATVGS